MYQIEFSPRAAEDFERLDQVVAVRVLKKLGWLAENFDSVKLEPLTGPWPVSSRCEWATIELFTRPTERTRC